MNSSAQHNLSNIEVRLAIYLLRIAHKVMPQAKSITNLGLGIPDFNLQLQDYFPQADITEADLNNLVEGSDSELILGNFKYDVNQLSAAFFKLQQVLTEEGVLFFSLVVPQKIPVSAITNALRKASVMHYRIMSLPISATETSVICMAAMNEFREHIIGLFPCDVYLVPSL